MSASEIMSVLREQAVGTPEARGSGYADVAWRYQHERGALALSGPWAALCDAFQKLVADAPGWAKSGVPLEISYPVSEVLTSALHLAAIETDPSVRSLLLGFSWRVACGWEAVLAGDIDDVAEHVANEASARAIPPLSDE